MYQARTERFNVWRSLMDCKLKEGDPLSPHVIKMIRYVQALDRLGFPLLDELATEWQNRILRKAHIKCWWCRNWLS